MKSLLVSICCLALASVAQAEPQDNKPKKKQAAAAPQQQAQTAKPAKQSKAQRQLSRAPSRTQAGAQSGPSQLKTKQKLATQSDLPAVQSKKQLRKQEKLSTQSSDLPAVQSKKQLRKQEKLSTQSSDLPAVQSKKQLRKQEKLSTGDTVAGVRSKAERRQAKRFDLQQSAANLEKVEKVRFKEGRHIEGSQHWHGDNYVVFRNYRSSWHDRDWWHHHHSRIVFILGGWYFWNSGFWYPAWGYDRGAVYAYDGPIYAYNDLPPDQVVANVQAELQAQGYYQGEVDGLLGPLTRAAIANYQRDRGLYITSAIDRPTMESLGFA